MLTAKHVDVFGEEKIFSVTSVEYKAAEEISPHKARAGFNPSLGRCRFLFTSKISGEIDRYFYEGSVYVMNESGKTVATYDLGGWGQVQVTAYPAAVTVGTVSMAQPQPADLAN